MRWSSDVTFAKVVKLTLGVYGFTVHTFHLTQVS